MENPNDLREALRGARLKITLKDMEGAKVIDKSSLSALVVMETHTVATGDT